MKTTIPLFIVALTLALTVSAQTARISPNDLKPIEGAQWVGTLTYLDYGTNKKTSIKSNITISRSEKAGNVWNFDYQYPDEPKANSKSEPSLSADGSTFDGATVLEKTVEGGKTRIVMIKPGKDNNRTAVYRYTYEFGDGKFSVRRDVKIEGTEEFFERNTYSWTR